MLTMTDGRAFAHFLLVCTLVWTAKSEAIALCVVVSYDWRYQSKQSESQQGLVRGGWPWIVVAARCHLSERDRGWRGPLNVSILLW